MHTATTDPIAHLWDAARALFERMRVVVGEAAAIALRAALARDEARALRAWLRALEGLVRRLVLIEAAALARQPEPPPAAKPVPRAPRKATSRPRTRGLRLWPRTPPPPARIRSLGPPLLVRDIWRDRARLAASRHLASVRGLRAPEPVRLARRIAALARVLDKPLTAARRLARKLRALPSLAVKLAAKRPPRSRYVDQDAQAEADRRAFAAIASRGVLDSS